MAPRVDVQYVKYYTSGSAARRVMPVSVFPAGILPKIKKHKVQRIYVDPVAALGIVVAVCMLIMMSVGISRLSIQQEKTAQMAEYVAQLQEENRALQDQYAAECDMEAVEKTALALGMIPREQAEHISIQVELPAEEMQQVSLWQRIGTFLTGLFA